jgi:DSF synthase
LLSHNPLDELNGVTMRREHFNNYFSPHYFKQVEIDFNYKRGILWLYMKPSGRSCITPGLLRELRRYQHGLMRWRGSYLHEDNFYPVEYQITTSGLNGIFNYGGDLELFIRAIKENDRDTLMQYGTACIKVVHANAVNYNLSVTTISLINGDALGGGLEGALSSSFVIAESGAQMGFPEIMFNLFPGMGAYDFLCRRVAPSLARRIIMSGQLYSAEEFYDMGIVDSIAEKGCGAEAVEKFIKKHKRSRNGYTAFEKVTQKVNPIIYDSLSNTVKIWVDAALRLSSKDLKIMERLAKAQITKNSEKIENNIVPSNLGSAS